MDNAREVGGDVYQPVDAEEEDVSVHEGDLTREEEDVDPDGNLLGPLPEEEAAMQAAMRAGDEAAALALARWQELRAEGKVVDYGTQATSPSNSYQDDEDVYDLVEDEVPPPPKRIKGVESSRAAEERALAIVPPPQLRRVRPEPADEEVVGDTANPLDEWPTLDQHVPVQQWHPSRLTFDDRGHLVLPPGAAAFMYGFLPQARTEVQQLELHSPEAQKYLSSGGAGSGRPSLDFAGLNSDYYLWDPRLQNLFSQVAPSEIGQEISLRRKKWRDAVRYQKVGIRLQELHQQADQLGIP